MAWRFKYIIAAAVVPFLVQASTATAQDARQGFKADQAEFLNSCASCHGRDGKGAGFLTRVFRGVDPGDLTQLAAMNDGEFPFDRVFQVIDGRDDIAAHGDRQMPVWGDRYMERSMSEYGPDELNRLRVRSRILELTNYIQSIQERE
jgi:mono/diheme cytochrome c family protein